MSDFFRFPHTPHIAWLGDGQPRDDKVLPADEARAFLGHEVLVEEKVDGANVGFSLDEQVTLRVQNRGSFLSKDHCHPQFKTLWRWLQTREQALADALYPDLMLFGEWCFAVHSVRYNRLPDWFLAFDVYDRSQGQFLSTARRDDIIAQLGLAKVPVLGQRKFKLAELSHMLKQSQLGDAPAEGLYVRRDEGEWLAARAKLVRPEFVQAIEEHWSRRSIEVNELAAARSARSWH